MERLHTVLARSPSKTLLEPYWFSDADLETLKHAAERMKDLLPRLPPPYENVPEYHPVAPGARPLSDGLQGLERTIARVQYLRLKQQLQVGYLPEVDVDRRLFLSRLQALGFPPDVEAAVNEVDEQLRNATSGLDLKRCVELLRTVFEKVTERAAEDTFTKRGAPMPPATGPRRFVECLGGQLKTGNLWTGQNRQFWCGRDQ